MQTALDADPESAAAALTTEAATIPLSSQHALQRPWRASAELYHLRIQLRADLQLSYYL